MNMTQSIGALCEMELKGGNTCGVTAIGRCATCERAFCASHQAHALVRSLDWPFYSTSVALASQCKSCNAKYEQVAQEANAKDREKRAKYDEELAEQERKHFAPQVEAEQYFLTGAARNALITSGVQPVKIYKTQWELKNVLFGLSSRSVEKVVSVQRGWFLGELPWSYTRRVSIETVIHHENCLTALMDLEVPNTFASRFDSKLFVRVQRYSGGYKDARIGFESHGDVTNWIAAAQAVKRLIGASS